MKFLISLLLINCTSLVLGINIETIGGSGTRLTIFYNSNNGQSFAVPENLAGAYGKPMGSGFKCDHPNCPETIVIRLRDSQSQANPNAQQQSNVMVAQNLNFGNMGGMNGMGNMIGMGAVSGMSGMGGFSGISGMSSMAGLSSASGTVGTDTVGSADGTAFKLKQNLASNVDYSGQNGVNTNFNTMPYGGSSNMNGMGGLGYDSSMVATTGGIGGAGGLSGNADTSGINNMAVAAAYGGMSGSAYGFSSASNIDGCMKTPCADGSVDSAGLPKSCFICPGSINAVSASESASYSSSISGSPIYYG